MLLASDLKKIYRHPSITKCQDVSEIILPLLNKHGITVFNYYKYCDDGMIRLSTHRAWTEHYFNKGYPSIHTVPSTYLQKKLNYFIWVIDDCPQILRDAAFNFNISNGISIAKKTRIDLIIRGERESCGKTQLPYLSAMIVVNGY